MSDTVAFMNEQSATVTEEQIRALEEAVLAAWTALCREGYAPERIEADWLSWDVMCHLDRFVRVPGFQRLCGFQIEQHDDSGIRAVGRRGDTFKTLTLEPWP